MLIAGHLQQNLPK